MTQNNLISIVTMWNKVNESSRENLSQRHEIETKKIRSKRPETDMKLEFYASDAGKEGIVCCFALLENIKRQFRM